MKVEVLASVMNQSLDKIAEEMALDSEAGIINQRGQPGYQEEVYRGNSGLFYTSPIPEDPWPSRRPPSALINKHSLSGTL